MFTFQPNWILKIRTIFAWLEAQIRSEWICIFQKDARLRADIMDALSTSTMVLLHKAQAVWQDCDITPPTWANEDTVLSLTGVYVPGPALFLLHFRLSVEIEHFTNITEKQIAWKQHLDDIKSSRINQMLPSWEGRLRTQHASRLARSRQEWKHAWKKELSDASGYRWISAFPRIAVSVMSISIIGAFTAYVMLNQNNIIEAIALVLSSYGTTFEAVYSAFSVAVVMLCCTTVVISMELLYVLDNNIRNDDLYDVIYQVNENTQDRLAEIAERQEHPFPDDIPLPYIQIVREKQEVGNGHK